MDYSTYWSVLDTPSKSIQPALVFLWIAIAAGVIWLLARKFQKKTRDGDKAIVLWATGVIAVLGFTGYVLLTFYPDKSNVATWEMLNASTTPRVEGVVSDFERSYRDGRRSGETIEKFTVDSIRFTYGDAALGRFTSFAQTRNNVIFNGQRVRITYAAGSPYGKEYNSILKLEIAY